jgi:hypothetical protein
MQPPIWSKVTPSCRNSPKSPLWPSHPCSQKDIALQNAALGNRIGAPALGLEMRPRLEGRHRGQDHIKAGIILRRCPRAAAENHWAYLLAFVSVGVATVLRLAIGPHVDGLQFATYLPAVIITTLISGSGAGLLPVVLSCASIAFLCFRLASLSTSTLKSLVMCWPSFSIRA